MLKTHAVQGQLAKKTCTAIDCSDVCESQLERGAFRFHPVDSEWQNEACRRVGANYQQPFRFGRGGLDCPLTNPKFKTVRRVFSDGNCLSVPSR